MSYGRPVQYIGTHLQVAGLRESLAAVGEMANLCAIRHGHGGKDSWTYIGLLSRVRSYVNLKMSFLLANSLAASDGTLVYSPVMSSHCGTYNLGVCQQAVKRTYTRVFTLLACALISFS